MALAKLGRYNERVVALDGDTNNLTFSEIFKNEHPNRYVECYIAQQNMVCSLAGYRYSYTLFSFPNLLIWFFSCNYKRKNCACVSFNLCNLTDYNYIHLIFGQ